MKVSINSKDDKICLTENESIICGENNCILCDNLGFCSFRDNKFFNLASKNELISRYYSYNCDKISKNRIENVLLIHYKTKI